ncbi:MAG: hypothetical protein WCF93_03610, partial [Candidatus Moraniibacteriota bacterium]
MNNNINKKILTNNFHKLLPLSEAFVKKNKSRLFLFSFIFLASFFYVFSINPAYACAPYAPFVFDPGQCRCSGDNGATWTAPCSDWGGVRDSWCSCSSRCDGGPVGTAYQRFNQCMGYCYCPATCGGGGEADGCGGYCAPRPPCPINGGWSGFGSCSATCGGGT